VNHTPGPWKFALFDADPNQAFVQWKSGYAAVHGAREGREANARLIATAPEMLEALKLASSIIGHPDDSVSQSIVELIAKAEGKS